MLVGVVQFKPELFKIRENVERAYELIKNESADIFVFPELAFTGYTFKKIEEIKSISEDVNGYSVQFFRRFCVEKKTNVVFGFVEKDGEKVYNSAILIKPDGSYRIYRKTHLFFEEKLFFTPGDTGFWVEDVNGVKVGVAICFDWFFPESFRTLALKGAQLIAHPSNLVMPYCQEANKIRSLENRLFIATANRWGEEINGEKKYKFTGMSQLTDPKGNVVFRLEPEGDYVKIIEIDENFAYNKQINNFNDIIKDRRPEFYG